jgi:glycosyltransferase involved in cell wall biosynthesis
MKIILLNLTASRIFPDAEKIRGLGASDSAIICVSRHLAELGHDVTLYANSPREGVYDGVRWKNYVEGESCDVLIANRTFLNTDKFQYKKLILWSHDDLDAPVLKDFEKNVHKADMVLAVSTYHRNQLLKIKANPKKLIVLGNAVNADLKRMNPKKERAICYCSIPFKGLPHLVKIWRRMRDVIPDIKLHICSGMSLYNAESQDIAYSELYKEIQADPRVVYHGVLPNQKVFNIMESCMLMVYPNSFPETFCCAAYESIHAGTPVITTDLGALPETVGDCGMLIKGDPTTLDYEDKMIEIVKDCFNGCHALTSPDLGMKYTTLYKLLSERCKKRQILTWADKAIAIDSIIKNLMEKDVS